MIHGSTFFSQRSVNRWNNLSQAEVDAPSINSFKNLLEERRLRKMDFLWTNLVHLSYGCTIGKLHGTSTLSKTDRDVQPHLVSYVVSPYIVKLSNYAWKTMYWTLL